jgi:hypothetical protein
VYFLKAIPSTQPGATAVMVQIAGNMAVACASASESEMSAAISAPVDRRHVDAGRRDGAGGKFPWRDGGRRE